MGLRRRLIALVLWLPITGALVACGALVPATVPPHIKNTPGASVTVTDKHIDAGAFRLAFPAAWKVVKANPASVDAMHLAFLAPDGGVVSLWQVDSVDAGDGQHLVLENGVIIRASIDAAAEPDAAFPALARQLLASIGS